VRGSRRTWSTVAALAAAAVGGSTLALALPAPPPSDRVAASVATGTTTTSTAARPMPPTRESTTTTTSAVAPGADAAFSVFAVAPVAAYLTTQAGTSLDLTAAVYDAKTGQTWTYRPSVTLTTASVVKLDILEAMLARGQAQGTSLTASQQSLAAAMMEESTNDAANDLWDTVGGAAAIEQYNDQVGLTDTHLDPTGYWGLSTSTALDQVRLVQAAAFPNPALTDASRQYVTGLMQHVVAYEDWGVSTGVPEGVSVALKNGWDPVTGVWEINSDGWVLGDGQDYAISILCGGAPTETTGIDAVDALARLIWNALPASPGPAP
jgi:Beta-lactamase enzyme family